MARPTDGLSGVRWASGDGPVRTPAPTGLSHRTWFVKMFAGAHNVHPYKRYTEAFRLTRDGAPRPSLPTEIYITTALLASTAAFAALGQRNDHQAPGASRGEVGRAAAGAGQKGYRRGDARQYHLLCESYRRRVRSYAVNPRTSLPRGRRSLGFLGGSESGLCALKGAKARLSGHLSSLLLTFELHQKSVARGRNPRPLCCGAQQVGPAQGRAHRQVQQRCADGGNNPIGQ